MIIELYINNAEKNRLDKSSFLVPLHSLSGTLRDSTSIVNPSILIELPFESNIVLAEGESVLADAEEVYISNEKNLQRVNYAYIPQFHRYYYIVDIRADMGFRESKGTRLYILSLVCDVLMSFKDSIRGNSAMIERNEFEYDETLVDSEMPFSNDCEITEIPINKTFDFYSYQNDNSHYIAVTTYATRNGLETLFKKAAVWLRESQMIKDIEGRNGYIDNSEGDFVSPSTASPQFQAITYIMTWNEFYRLLRVFLTDSQKTFIKSVTAFPFDLYDVVGETTRNNKLIPFVAGDDIAQKYGLSIPKFRFSTTNDLTKKIEIGNFTLGKYDFSKSNPFSIYRLYHPFLGYFDLDYETMAEKHYEISAYICLSDATGVIYLRSSDDSRVLSQSFECGTRVPIDATNSQEVINNNISNAISTALNVLASVASIAGGIVTENPVAIAGGAISMGKAIGGSITQALNNLPKGQLANSNPNLKFIMPVYPRIVKIAKKCLVTDFEKYRSLHGSPLKQVRSLSSLSGFTIVSEIHLENVAGYATELDSIVSFLKSGVIL